MRMFRSPVPRQSITVKPSMPNKSYLNQPKVLYRNINTKPTVENPSKSQQAILNVKSLYEKGQYKEALKEINRIEDEFPSASKAAKHLRGKVSIALLDNVQPSQEATVKRFK